MASSIEDRSNIYKYYLKKSRLVRIFSNKCSRCCLMAFHNIWLQVRISNNWQKDGCNVQSLEWIYHYLICIINSYYIIENNLCLIFAQIRFLCPPKPGNFSRKLTVVGARVVLSFNDFFWLHWMTWPRKAF